MMKFLGILLTALALAAGVPEFTVGLEKPAQAQFAGLTIIMLAPAPSMSFSVHGHVYQASDIGLVVNVVPADVSGLQAQGCILLTPRNAVSLTRAPLGTDDFTAEFGIGSQWVRINGSTPTFYVLTSMGASPGSAVWNLVSSGSGSGSVTSVGLSLPGIFSVTGTPVTTTGTLTATLANESANFIFAGPSSGSPGAPGFRTVGLSELTGLISSGQVSGAYPGISGVGTIASGVWHGTAIDNAHLANSAITVEGQTCTLGSTCITAAQATAFLNPFSSSLQGAVPASGGGTTNFLRADGTWSSVSGAVNSVTGTANKITASPTTGAVVLTLPDPISLGTVSAGIWNGTAIDNAHLANSVITIEGQTCTLGSTCITAPQATAFLNPFSSVLQGVVPASGGGTTNFLRADGAWSPVAGAVASVTGTANQITASPTTGAVVLTLPSTLNLGTIATGTWNGSPIGNSFLANSSITIEGQTCTLGSTCITAAQATAFLNNFSSSLKGAVPASGGGTANFLRADGNWSGAVASSGGSASTLTCTTCTLVGNTTLPGSGVITSAGKLGLGVSPTQVLSVAGTIGISEVAGAGNRLQISTSGAGAIINQNDNSDIFFQIQGSNFLTIKNTTGRVGIGTTSPSYTLDVNGGGRIQGDALFQSGRPWCDVRAQGAVGDGVTDDTSAMQACITTIKTAGGGTVYFPPSTGNAYCTFTGLTVTGGAAQGYGIHMMGASSSAIGGTVVSACGHDATVFKLNGAWSMLENMFIVGKGVNDTGSFGATAPAVWLDENCISCKLQHLFVWGGSNALRMDAVDAYTEDVNASYGYGSAIVFITAGQWFVRDKFDQAWPAGLIATQGVNPPSWAQNTVYTNGTVVRLSQGGHNVFLQATTSSGTSCNVGSGPTLKNYGVTMTDCGVTWLLVAPQAYYGVQIGSLSGGAATGEIQFVQTDFTVGGAQAGLALDPTGGGTVPNLVKVVESVFGQEWTTGIYLNGGYGVSITDAEIGECLLPGCSGIFTTSGFTGDLGIMNSLIWTVPYGILLGGGVNTNIIGNRIYGTTSAIFVSAGVSDFIISGNSLGSSPAYGASAIGVTVDTGASNHYQIIGNDFNGAGTAVVDNGSGTDKTVCTTNAACTSGNMTVGTLTVTGNITSTGGTNTFSGATTFSSGTFHLSGIATAAGNAWMCFNSSTSQVSWGGVCGGGLDASNLTGTTINGSVTNSSLTGLGTLGVLRVSNSVNSDPATIDSTDATFSQEVLRLRATAIGDSSAYSLLLVTNTAGFAFQVRGDRQIFAPALVDSTQSTRYVCYNNSTGQLTFHAGGC